VNRRQKGLARFPWYPLFEISPDLLSRSLVPRKAFIQLLYPDTKQERHSSCFLCFHTKCRRIKLQCPDPCTFADDVQHKHPRQNGINRALPGQTCYELPGQNSTIPNMDSGRLPKYGCATVSMIPSSSNFFSKGVKLSIRLVRNL
jgi:hypothetical protein